MRHARRPLALVSLHPHKNIIYILWGVGARGYAEGLIFIRLWEWQLLGIVLW